MNSSIKMKNKKSQMTLFKECQKKKTFFFFFSYLTAFGNFGGDLLFFPKMVKQK